MQLVGRDANAGDVFPPVCGTAQSRPGQTGLSVGSRNTTMSLLADAIYGYGSMAGEVDQPVVDQTGLKGTFDFTIEYGSGGILAPVRPNSSHPDGPPIRQEHRF